MVRGTSIAFGSFVIAFGMTSMASSENYSPRECKGLFAETVALSLTEKNVRLAEIADRETKSALARWSQAPATPLRKPSRALVPYTSKPASPASLNFQAREANLTSLFTDFEFYRKGAAPGASLDLFGSPRINAVAQFLVTRDSVALIRPNIEHSVRTGYGTAPLRARLNQDGSLSNVGPLFQGFAHPLRKVDPTEFQYDLSVNLQTSVARAILTLTERPNADTSGVPMGSADVFFVSPTTGKEYPSLQTESGYRFSNVAALSDTLYIAEVANRSNRGVKGEVLLLEYDPAGFIFRKLMEFPPAPASPNSLASIFRVQANRRVATGEIGLDHLLKIYTQTHSILIRLPDPDGDFAGEIAISLNAKTPAKRVDPDLEVGTKMKTIKVVPTQSQAPKAVYDMIMLTGERTHGNPYEATRKTYVALRDGPDTVMYWTVKADRLSPVFYRVNGGFVVQRDGENQLDPTSVKNTEGLPRGELHGLLFLSDSGQVVPVTESNIQGYGAFSIVDGHLFIVGPGGGFINIESVGPWR